MRCRRIFVAAFAVVWFVPLAASAGPIADLAVFHLNEGIGTTAPDASGNGYNGTLSGTAAPSWTTDSKFGTALQFTGGTGVVQTTLTAAQSLPLSIEAWVKPNSATPGGAIVNKYVGSSYNGFQVFFNGNHLAGWYLATSGHTTRTDGSADPGLVLTPGQWYHTVTVFDNVGTTHYVNGAMVAQAGWSGGPANSTETTPLVLGRYSSTFDGWIDEVAVYRRTVSATEAMERYLDGPPLPPAAPKATLVCMNFDEGRGTTTLEAVSNTQATLFSQGAASNALWTSAGKFDGGITLDPAKQQYVETGLTAAQSPPLTIEAWVKGATDLAAGHIGIVNKYIGSSMEGFQLFSSSGRLSAWYYTHATHVETHSTKALNDDLWHHVAVVFDAGGGRLFFDGQLAASGSWTAGMGVSNETTPLRLGAYPNPNPANFFKGSLDAVALYSRALSADEIVARYLDGPPIIPEPTTVVLLAIGSVGLALVGRRKRGELGAGL